MLEALVYFAGFQVVFLAAWYGLGKLYDYMQIKGLLDQVNQGETS